MIDGTRLPAVPKYNDLVARNNIALLSSPGDTVLRNGDFALTRWGDIMMVNEDYSAFFKLVNEYRYNYPTLKVLFNAVFEGKKSKKELSQQLQELFQPKGSSSDIHVQIDYRAYHRTNDAIGANEVARDVYAGSIIIVLHKIVIAFCDNIMATREEWKTALPLINGCSIGQILEASANNVRHCDEWQVTRPPNAQQLKSINILAAALCEPLDPPNGLTHRLSREVSPETLELISKGDFERLESTFFDFAQNLLKWRQHRLPTQDVLVPDISPQPRQL